VLFCLLAILGRQFACWKSQPKQKSRRDAGATELYACHSGLMPVTAHFS
jgi:hypothetical protein